ncbi:E3 ubiquitin-protein ligase NEURL3-like [Triplophysa dalaica]|uniref:E3 ubiquitin-protein ligase NEURL3-like n=1 Tax=Triplophysa dalaica TaxID=1582913 RepID=UPI0024E02F81|nr:E3 ubiquitin-protein ligase NEURL3-like [Triplophysa dalaica]
MTPKKKERKMQISRTESPHQCVCHKRRCLGALSFHSNVKGHLITLGEGGRRATRDESSFRHGLVFSERPLQIREKVRLRIERSSSSWQGSLRVGFANVSPENISVPPLAIPDLTDCELYAAKVLPDSTCYPGSEIEFWIDRVGSLFTRFSDGTTSFQSTTLNIHWPIWAMIDVYGQTTAVVLLGSKKKGLIHTYTSCPAFTHNKQKNHDCGYRNMSKAILESMSMQEHRNHQAKNKGLETFNCEDCVVCCSNASDTLLSCGHKCVCTPCAIRVYDKFGTCPLCRQCICLVQIN